MTNNTPIILLNIKVDDMQGTNSSIELQFLCNPNPDLIINGTLKNEIKVIIGKKNNLQKLFEINYVKRYYINVLNQLNMVGGEFLLKELKNGQKISMQRAREIGP